MSTEVQERAIEKRVTIPDGVQLKLDGSVLKVKGPNGELERNLWFPQVPVRIEDGDVVISTGSERKRVMAIVGTFAAHVTNMCTGVTRGFEYRMKVVYSHFPIQLKLQGRRLEITNFLGENEAPLCRYRGWFQNALPVTITILAWQFNAPLAVVIMLSVLAGAALMALVLFATGIKKSIDKRRAAARKGPGDQA